MAQPRILQSAPNHLRITAPFGSVAMQPGDLASYESNTIVLMDAAAEDASLAGYLINQNNTSQTEPASAVVGLQGMLEMDSTSATYTVGQGLALASTNQVVDHGAANTVGWSAEYKTSATRLDVIIDVIALGKLFETVLA